MKNSNGQNEFCVGHSPTGRINRPGPELQNIKSPYEAEATNEQQLLIAAGKAAGIVVKFLPAWGGGVVCWGNGHYWNPLTNSADALDLAVTLCLPVDITDEETVFEGLGIRVSHGEDAFAATRRAIVLAAAEMGKRP